MFTVQRIAEFFTIDEAKAATVLGGLMRNGRTIFRDHDPILESLNDAERELLTSCAGCIISEDSQGFVAVDYYDTAEELDAAWDAILAELTEDEDDEPTEPDEDDLTTTDHRTFYQNRKPVLRLATYPENGAAWERRGKGSWYPLPSSIGADDHEAALRAYMEHEQFWPNAWVISDHGNAHLY
jgi:hypothetical protein